MRKLSDQSPQVWRGESPRLAQWLRQKYPRDTAKMVAADVRAPVRTVENWLTGTAPSLAWVMQMILVWGPDFLGCIMDEQPQWLDDARAKEEGRRLDAELARLHARRAELERRS